jgi:hypothetical protein
MLNNSAMSEINSLFASPFRAGEVTLTCKRFRHSLTATIPLVVEAGCNSIAIETMPSEEIVTISERSAIVSHSIYSKVA